MKKRNSFCTLFLLAVLLLAMTLVVSADDADFEFTFKDGNLDNWAPRGNVTLEVIDDESYEGDYSLLTTGRTSDWHGPSIDIHDLVQEGELYEVSAWVRIASKEKEGEFIVTLELNDGNENSWERVVEPVVVEKGEWVELSGEYEIPSGYERITLYIESTNETLEYYVDNVKAVQQ